jgi:HD-GYP domain-containing protein (c-di-GMP phosphodiesterase class II)
VEGPLAAAQALRYAEELRDLFQVERAQRRRVEESLTELQDSYAATVRALGAALDLRDDVTGGHAERVTSLGLRLAEAVAPALLEDRQAEFGFLLHDIGKIGVRDAILLKPGPLTPAERLVMQQHPLHGQRILEQVPFFNGVARAIVVSHHERWDGSGYPSGLVGSGIPLAARIFAVVDAFDAMTNDRPYRSGLTVDTALAEIDREAGRQFDPNVAAQFVRVVTREAA